MSSKLSAFSALNGYCVYNNRCDGEYRVCRNNFGRDVNNKKREKVGFNQILFFFLRNSNRITILEWRTRGHRRRLSPIMVSRSY